MDLNEARSHIAKLFSQCDYIPKVARIEIRDDAPNQTTVLFFDWELKTARPLILKLSSSATQLFLNADTATLPKLDKILQGIVQRRLKQGYCASESQNKEFVMTIEDRDFR